MAENQRRYDLSRPCDVARLRQGVDIVIEPLGFLQELLWIDVSCGEFDRIAIFIPSFDLFPNLLDPPPVFPGTVWWSLRAGIWSAVDDRVPIAEVVTTLSSMADFGCHPGNHSGYLVRAQGVQSSTWALSGSVNREFGVKVYATLRVLVSAGGSTATVVATGGAVG